MADTMIMGDTVCNVVYVDAAIAVPGSGATPATAVANIPAVGSLANNTVYLIRRNANAGIVLTSGTNSTGSNIFLIGMPRSGDWLYERVPTAAKQVWDLDSPDYALANFSSYQISFSLTNIDRCGFHRLKFTRPSPNSNYGYSQCNGSMQLNVQATYSGSEYCTNGDYFFTNNWWCDAGYPLSDPNFKVNSPYHSGGIQFMYCRSLKFCDNHIEFCGSYNGNPSWNPTAAVCINYCRHQIVNDNEFWISSFGSNGNNFYAFTQYNTYYGQCYTEFNRNNCHWVCQNYTYTSFFVAFNLYTRDLISHNCNVTIDRYYNRTGISSGSYIGYGYSASNGGRQAMCHGKWDVQNILVDSGDCCNIGGSLIYLACAEREYAGYSAMYPGSIVRNITARCSSTGAIASSYGGWAMYLYLGREFNPVENIVAWNYQYYGLYAACDNTSIESWNTSCLYRNCSVKGRLDAHYVEFLHVTDWSLGTVPGTQKLYLEEANVYIERATIDPTQSWGTQQWLYFYNNCGNRLIIDWIDTPLYVNWSSAAAYDDCVIINNVQNVPGKWYGTNYYYTGQSWAVARAGGATSAVKLTGTVSDQHFTHLELSPYPFRGLEWTPQAAGAAKAVIHLAHKSMTNPTYLLKRMKFWLQVPWWDSVENLYQPRSVLGDIDGKLLDDSDAVWTGDTGLTQKKIEIPFMVTAPGQVITARLYFDWYDATGYVYLDPLIEFSMV